MNETAKKNKHRFNIIDVLIIIGIIAVIVFSFNMLTGDIFGQKIVNVHYTVKFTGVSTDNIDYVTNGSRIYSSNVNIPIGILEDIRIENSVSTEYSPSLDRYTEVENEGMYTVYADLVAGCVFRNGAYFTENMRISENTDISVNIPFPYDKAEIVSVSPKTLSEVE